LIWGLAQIGQFFTKGGNSLKDWKTRRLAALTPIPSKRSNQSRLRRIIVPLWGRLFVTYSGIKASRLNLLPLGFAIRVNDYRTHSFGRANAHPNQFFENFLTMFSKGHYPLKNTFN